MRTSFLLIVMLLLPFVTINANENGSTPDDKKKDEIVMPEFPGGVEELKKFLMKELHYPYQAQQIEARGEVVVEFFVERSGSITGVHVIKPVSTELDAEAIRVIRMMPRWKPGTKNGVAMRTQMSIPINFKILKSLDKYVDGENMDNGHENNSVQKDKVELK